MAELVRRAEKGEVTRDTFERDMLALALAFLLLSLVEGSGGSTEVELRAIEEVGERLTEAEAIAEESVSRLADDIYQRGTFTPDNPDTAAPQLSATEATARIGNRVALWVSTALGLYALGQTARANDPFLGWRVGPTEHCSDCLRLDGQVHRASEWRRSGWQPQGRNLECGGYHCQCEFYETTGPSQGGF